jgi:hypothetical protein
MNWREVQNNTIRGFHNFRCCEWVNDQLYRLSLAFLYPIGILTFLVWPESSSCLASSTVAS